MEKLRTVEPPSSSVTVRLTAYVPATAYVCAPRSVRETGGPQGLGYGSGLTPSLNTVRTSADPSPQSHAIVTSSEPGSAIAATRARLPPMTELWRSVILHEYVSGCPTLKTWWKVTFVPSGMARISHAGFAPFSCPFTGSSAGVYSMWASYELVTSNATVPSVTACSSGLPGIRTTVAFAISDPSLRRLSETSWYFSPATRRVTFAEASEVAMDAAGGVLSTVTLRLSFTVKYDPWLVFASAAMSS